VQLSALALRSKAHWGYDASFMERCVEELRVRTDVRDTFYAGRDDAIAGFYSLETTSLQELELEALFVDPPFIGKGVGMLLFRDAARRAYDRGASALTIQSDPHASDFYRHCGCRYVGSSESGSIPGRQLPVFSFDLGRHALSETAK
jgi:GNAT superfamily N-acetyltransferase